MSTEPTQMADLQCGQVWTRPDRLTRTIIEVSSLWVVYTVDDPDPVRCADSPVAWDFWVSGGAKCQGQTP